MTKLLKQCIALGLAGCLTLGATTVQGLRPNVQSQRVLGCHPALDFGPWTLDASYLEEQALSLASTQAVQPIAEERVEAAVRRNTSRQPRTQSLTAPKMQGDRDSRIILPNNWTFTNTLGQSFEEAWREFLDQIGQKEIDRLLLQDLRDVPFDPRTDEALYDQEYEQMNPKELEAAFREDGKAIVGEVNHLLPGPHSGINFFIALADALSVSVRSDAKWEIKHIFAFAAMRGAPVDEAEAIVVSEHPLDPESLASILLDFKEWEVAVFRSRALLRVFIRRWRKESAEKPRARAARGAGSSLRNDAGESLQQVLAKIPSPSWGITYWDGSTNQRAAITFTDFLTRVAERAAFLISSEVREYAATLAEMTVQQLDDEIREIKRVVSTSIRENKSVKSLLLDLSETGGPGWSHHLRTAYGQEVLQREYAAMPTANDERKKETEDLALDSMKWQAILCEILYRWMEPDTPASKPVGAHARRAAG